MSKLLVVHTDLDGIAPLVLENLYHNELGFDDTYSSNYGFELDPDVFNYLSSFDEVIFADISICQEKAIELRNKGIHLEFYDHHAASAWLENDESSSWKIGECGTKLFFEHYVKPRIENYNPVIDYFISLVDTYDLWQEDSPLWKEAKYLNDVLYGMINWKTTEYHKHDDFIKTITTQLAQSKNIWRWTLAEKELIDKSEKREDALFKDAMNKLQIRRDSKGKTFGVIALPSKISLVCSRVLKERPDLDYIVCIHSFRGMDGSISFRTRRDDFDLNTIAGANGHEKACGGQFSQEGIVRFFNNNKLGFIYKDEEGYVPEIDTTWTKEF